MHDRENFGILAKLFIAFFSAFFLHLLMVAVLGSFLDNLELKALLDGNTTLPVFYPTLIVCVVWVVLLPYLKK
jgi:hypothetical protein